VLECHAAQQAARRITAEQLGELKQQLDTLREIVGKIDHTKEDGLLEVMSRWTVADIAFHMTVLQAAANRQLIRMICDANLMPHSLDNTAWIAWQFDRPEEGEGMIQAFRRAESVYESARLRLFGLDPEAKYALTNIDVPGTSEHTGRDLMERGLLVAAPERPSAIVITYKRRVVK
jgi:hypothetical protein